MAVTVVTPPAAVVDLDLVRAHLRVDTNDEDDLIEAYLEAATGSIDGPAGWLGRSLGEQTLRASFDSFCGELLALPCRPLVAITSIKYDDSSGVEQTLSPSAYSLTADGVLRAYGTNWPSTRTQRGAVRVTYTAGYPDGIPKAIQAAILLMVGDLYANRETTAFGQLGAVPMSLTVERLLAPYRVWRL